MERVKIIVTGRVQQVGYRDIVAEIANSLNIGGRAKNLPDGSVRIIAEAEKDILERFISLIQPKDDPMIKVTSVDVKFEKATGEFEYFDIEYEDFEKEGFERIGIAAIYLKRIAGTLDGIDKKQDKMLEKLDSFHHDTIQRFDNLDIKYGRIADIMEKLTEALLKLAEKK